MRGRKRKREDLDSTLWELDGAVGSDEGNIKRHSSHKFESCWRSQKLILKNPSVLYTIVKQTQKKRQYLVEVFGLNRETLQYQYPQVYKLLAIYRTVLVSSATAERSFSTLAILAPSFDDRTQSVRFSDNKSE
jgi:hypothetical protein